ncbi:Clp protease N-terminal domain-containing protein [Gordonia soli]|uniref:Clp R domain-containing protein n=1 Tax=Gordonia soli NBRC 108243 TaxID=1223545 RepID=M0QQT5_9ACTN|nr:Clp protease N-terminal domain-containing protein [Gordonia soli]GAC70626.1 hypothetical protein GS4_38_00320 [Gordonia soli NBRC 108243]
MAVEPRLLTNVRLDDLIAAIQKVHDEPLEQLSGAVVAAEHLGDVADSLIGHFVDQARRNGASWTEIGSSMGVTKQAAQKRFVARAKDAPTDANPFARFTPRAKNSIVAAHEAAVAAESAAVTPEHLALGLFAEPESLAVLALRAQDVDTDRLAELLRASSPKASTPADDEPPAARAFVPYDDRSKAVLETTVTTAVGMGHNYVGTEHLLIALFTDETVAAVLDAVGAEASATRTHVEETLAQI